MWDESGRVIEERSLEMARPFPMAVGGHLRSASFDRNASTLTLNVTVAAGAPANASSTVVFVSLGLYFPRGFSAAVTAQPADATASIASTRDVRRKNVDRDMGDLLVKLAVIVMIVHTGSWRVYAGISRKAWLYGTLLR